MRPIIVIRYGELSLKGKNRKHFEDVLMRNIETALADFPITVKRRFGRLIVLLNDDADQQVLAHRLQRVFGIANFSFGYDVATDLEEMRAAAMQLCRETDHWDTFRIQTRRSNKTFPIKSMDIDKEIGSTVGDAFPDAAVQLINPDLTVFIEIEARSAFVSGKKIPGAGGLPVGTSADVLCLISGGIDSPVAAWHAMKRGSRVHFIHFHSAPYTSQASIEKVQELVERLNEWQGPSTFINVPFIDVQKTIMTTAKSTYGVILYRRFMFRIAQIFAASVKAKALVTGEAVGQVASQTIENIAAINDVTTLPVLRPLISMDKNDIMALAKTIGTYETSIVPHDDCCTLFVPKHPVTKATVGQTRKQEEALDVESLVQTAVSTADVTTTA